MHGPRTCRHRGWSPHHDLGYPPKGRNNKIRRHVVTGTPTGEYEYSTPGKPSVRVPRARHPGLLCGSLKEIIPLMRTMAICGKHHPYSGQHKKSSGLCKDKGGKCICMCKISLLDAQVAYIYRIKIKPENRTIQNNKAYTRCSSVRSAEGFAISRQVTKACFVLSGNRNRRTGVVCSSTPFPPCFFFSSFFTKEAHVADRHNGNRGSQCHP